MQLLEYFHDYLLKKNSHSVAKETRPLPTNQHYRSLYETTFYLSNDYRTTVSHLVSKAVQVCGLLKCVTVVCGATEQCTLMKKIHG